MKTLCYIEGPYKIESVPVVGKTVYVLYRNDMAAKAYDTVGAALDAITRIKTPQNIEVSWSDCDGVNCRSGCNTCYPFN